MAWARRLLPGARPATPRARRGSRARRRDRDHASVRCDPRMQAGVRRAPPSCWSECAPPQCRRRSRVAIPGAGASDASTQGARHDSPSRKSSWLPVPSPPRCPPRATRLRSWRAFTGTHCSQTVDPVRKPGVPPRGLPALRFPDSIRSPEIPRRLGWLNYWSAAAARAIGFPDPARDAELLPRSRRTATGGWVVRLTDAPLDLDNPAHLDALKRAYERFPEIGGRSIS